MAQLGPFTVTAHNGAQAEYLLRSRAEQRGVGISAVEVTEGSPGRWLVTVTVADAAAAEAARLGDDTQVLHLNVGDRRGGSG
jgi:hypothetical protein